MRDFMPTLSDEQLLQQPTVLRSSVRDMADTLQRYGQSYGLTHVSVLHQYAASFSNVIAQLR
jgi:hypothetical protein